MPVRIGKEVQKMLRCLILLAALAVANAAALPDAIGGFAIGKVSPLRPPDAALYGEFGLQAAERAEYSANGQSFTVEAWRLRDATGAFALFEEMRPAGATPSDVEELAVRTGDGLIAAYGNYVLHFRGHIPGKEELDTVFLRLPEMEVSALPTLPGYVPAQDKVLNSERYILGPVALEKFESRIPSSMAAFSMGAEAQAARYRGGIGMVVFSYPTPNMARDRQAAFVTLPKTLAKRAGPLLAVIVDPPDPNEAEAILARVNWEAKVTLSEAVEENSGFSMGRVIVTAFLLAGVIGLVSLLAGLGLGSLRHLLARWGWGSGPAIQPLRLDDD